MQILFLILVKPANICLTQIFWNHLLFDRLAHSFDILLLAPLKVDKEFTQVFCAVPKVMQKSRLVFCPQNSRVQEEKKIKIRTLIKHSKIRFYWFLKFFKIKTKFPNSFVKLLVFWKFLWNVFF